MLCYYNYKQTINRTQFITIFMYSITLLHDYTPSWAVSRYHNTSLTFLQHNCLPNVFADTNKKFWNIGFDVLNYII